MNLSLQNIALLLCALVTLASSTPADLFTGDLEVRSEPDSHLAVREIFDLDARNEFGLETRDVYEFEARDTSELEARGGGGGAGSIVEVVEDVVKMIINVVGTIKADIAADKAARSGFTQDAVGRMYKKNPKFTYFICCSKHTTAFTGKQGVDWGHSHEEFKVHFGKTVGYEIYWAKSGKFTRIGDGGYLNWAYIGNVKSRSSDGKVVTFG